MKPSSLLPDVQRTLGLAAVVAAAMVIPELHADDLTGNGNTGFGGTIGLGTLTLSDDGTTVSGSFSRVSGTFDNVLVLYIDSVSGGFFDTSTLGDSDDGLRRAISGFDGGGNRSTLTFASGFDPDYALALGPQSDSFGGLWELAAGGGGSLPFVSSLNLSPTGGGSGSAATFTFSFNLADIGLTPGAGETFGLFGTYISNTGYRSDEAVAGNLTGTQGWTPFTQTAFATYATTPIPEPTAMALLLLGSGMLWLRRRR